MDLTYVLHSINLYYHPLGSDTHMRTENVYHARARSENIGDPSLSHVSTFIFRRQPRGFWHAIYLLNVVVGHGTRVVFTHMPLHSSVVTLYGGCPFYEFT